MRLFFAIRYEQLKRIAPLISIVLNAGTFSMVLYNYISWRGLSISVIPLLFLFLIGFTTILAAIYYGPMNMRKFERTAMMKMDPAQNGILTPKEARFLTLLVQTLKGDSNSLNELEEWAQEETI